MLTSLIGLYNINWAACRLQVLELQCAIAVAWKAENWSEVYRLQQKLVRSYAARALAVRKVITNKGGKTPGIDGVVWVTPEQALEAIDRLKDLSKYKAIPVKRIYILKANGKKRPLGIPTMFDRAVQALWALALLPIAESVADKRSYGYRPYRSVHDVAIYVKLVAGSHYGKRWILEGDIKGFFDNISHEWLLENIPMDKRILKEFLKAGFVEEGNFNDTELGTPQGSLISPIFANMVLDGLEELADGVYTVRYADDFVVMSKTKELLVSTLPLIEAFLQERGLSLNMEKTQMVSIKEGFDFVGLHFREYPDKSRIKGTKEGIFLVKPGRKSISNLKAKLRTIVKDHRSKPINVLISVLNPILRGWAEQFRSVTSSKVFSAIGNYLWTILWNMVKRRSRGVPLRKLRFQYFKTVGGNNWVLFGKDSKGNEVTLFQMGWVSIKRHSICPNLNPFLPENTLVFQKRVKTGAKQSVTANKYQSLLVAKQDGICPVCEGRLFNGEALEVHHRLSRREGGKDTTNNLVLLHKLCHVQVTHSKSKQLRASWLARRIILSPK